MFKLRITITICFVLSAKMMMAAVSDSIIAPKIDIRDNRKEVYEASGRFVIDSVAITNPQLDSILSRTTKDLPEKSQLAFAITFMRYQTKIYFEIMGFVPDNNFITVKKVGQTYDNYLSQGSHIYGYTQSNKRDIYVAIFPSPNDASEDDIKCFFQKTEKTKVIKKTAPTSSSLALFENPMWLYQYINGKTVFLKSVFDKGFFTFTEKNKN